MKAHTSGFKEQIKTLGRELDIKITYTINNETIVLTSEDINNLSLHYDGNILRSVMKTLEIDSNLNIPVNVIINLKIGLKVNGEYEYLNYGNYVVYASDKQEDVNSYMITCYDKMLYSMKNYENLNIEYPITINNFINSICTKLGLTFSNYNSEYANCDKEIEKELYLDLNYTYRDVLDELAQVTASTICINNNDELEIRYINNTNDTIDEEYFKDINVKFGKKYGPINSVVLSRSAESDNVYLQNESSIEENGLCEVKIFDNQIMNWNDRSNYLPDILEKLSNIEYYINDFSSTGICYYELCDKYNIKIGENTYNCILFNDEIKITQGLEEIIFTDLPKESETDYKKADKTDQKINKINLIVDKQNQTINAIIEKTDEASSKVVEMTADLDGIKSRVTNTETSIEETNSKLDKNTNNLDEKINQETVTRTTEMNELRNSVNVVTEFKEEVEADGVKKVNTGTTIVDIDGVHVDNSTSVVKSDFASNGAKVVDKNTNNTQFFSGVVTETEAEQTEELTKYINQAISYSDNIYVKNFFETPGGRWEPVYRNGEGHGIGFFPVEEV